MPLCFFTFCNTQSAFLVVYLQGELTITADMENLQNALYFNTVPDSWTKRAYPSMNGLSAWYADLLLRIKDFENWVSDFNMPSCIWLAGFFNPQSFLTAIMQSMARKNEWPLDKMCLQCDVTKKHREDFSSPPREGAYIHGLFMEGARSVPDYVMYILYSVSLLQWVHNVDMGMAHPALVCVTHGELKYAVSGVCICTCTRIYPGGTHRQA